MLKGMNTGMYHVSADQVLSTDNTIMLGLYSVDILAQSVLDKTNMMDDAL